MSIVLELTPAEEERLRREAADRQMELSRYIREKVLERRSPLPASPDGNHDPDGQVYSIAQALSVLEMLAKPEYQVSDAEWKAFQEGIDASRPGQRSLYGQGINPPTGDETHA